MNDQVPVQDVLDAMGRRVAELATRLSVAEVQLAKAHAERQALEHQLLQAQQTIDQVAHAAGEDSG